jgi:iron complex outermembrane receptor protein
MTGTRAWMLPLIAALALFGPQVVLADQATDSTDQTFDFFLQEAKVVSASRREQNKSDSPVAIEVITHDDIVASGATNIVELLRFQVGIDVAESTSLEGNAAQVNVRGLPQEFAQNMQVRVDGRSVVSPTNAGVFWQSLPIGLDDIDRIEIVRGPNAALYGANAGQGVINIITIKPVAGSTGVALHGQVGSDGRQWEHLAMTLGEGPLLGWISLDNNIHPSDPSPSGNRSNDLDSMPTDDKLNARLDASPWKNSDLELFVGHSDQAYAIPPWPGGGLVLVSSGSNTNTYGMAQLHQALGDDSYDISLSGSQNERTYGQSDIVETEIDLDALYRLSLLQGKLLTTLGGSFDRAGVDSAFLFNYGYTSGGPTGQENRAERAYVQEAWAVLDRLSLDLAASFENSDTGGEQPAYQGALVYKPFEGHSLRLSASHSPTMPSLQNKYAGVLYATGFFAGPDPIAADMVVGRNVEPAQVNDYEATWSSELFDRHVAADITAYQMELNGQIGFQAGPPPSPGFGPFTGFAPLPNGQQAAFTTNAYVQYANNSSALLRGVESVLTFKPMAGTQFQLNHTYEDVRFHSANGPRDAFLYETTPWNKVNLLGQSQLPWGFNASADLGWVGGHYANSSTTIGHQWIDDQAVVDLRLGYKPTKDLEIYGLGQNLDHAYRTEAADGTAQAQTWYAGLNLAWGAGK